MATLKAIMLVLPQLIKIVQSVAKAINGGAELAQLKWDLKRINNAFEEKDPKKRANKLNIIFRK